MKVIEPVTHSEWAAPIVCVRKSNGKLRVCADFSTGLNKALETFDYPLPVPEDIFATLNGGAVFSQIDLSDAYLQIELSDESKKMVVINTHRGKKEKKVTLNVIGTVMSGKLGWLQIKCAA
ncbi:hypothetical protein ANCCEY_13466 [Ancylostoma ceylanicum]|uniref:Reverse transcriptase domain-containing protein n=1 Tax=Ancylostoma ceylanicum TaxID=53326 RepID=A0A0D6LC84_9BILA|nr:hypothetical protein ANCCEY_13466 [Ancylostoma ceylanicum]